jgi:hypothetical protein
LIRILAAIVLITTLATWPTEIASACTCAVRPPAEMIEESEAAFIGRGVVSRVEPPVITTTADLVTYTFEVESVAKGNLYEFVKVVSPISVGSCGFGDIAQDGRRLAITLYLNDDHSYQSGYCSTMAPTEMASAGIMTKPLRSGAPNLGVLNTPVPVPDERPPIPKDELYQSNSDSRPSSWVISAGLGLVSAVLFGGYRIAIHRKNTQNH